MQLTNSTLNLALRHVVADRPQRRVRVAGQTIQCEHRFCARVIQNGVSIGSTAGRSPKRNRALTMLTEGLRKRQQVAEPPRRNARTRASRRTLSAVGAGLHPAPTGRTHLATGPAGGSAAAAAAAFALASPLLRLGTAASPSASGGVGKPRRAQAAFASRDFSVTSKILHF